MQISLTLKDAKSLYALLVNYSSFEEKEHRFRLAGVQFRLERLILKEKSTCSANATKQ